MKGYLGPIALLTPADCREVAAHLRRSDLEPGGWEKARAAQDRFLFDLATRPRILELVTTALGPDVVLWGATAVVRAPAEAHPWHSDIESCGPEGGFVSVWIGIENTSRESSLQLIAKSHLLGASVQELRARHGIAREDATPAALLELVRDEIPDAELVEPDMSDGDAIVFDGRLWHGTDNRRRRGARTALLLQYAAAARAVRIPDWDELDWPFRIRAEPLPPVLAVSGSTGDSPNHVVPPPVGWSGRIRSVVHGFDLSLADGRSERWQPFPAFHGETPIAEEISCHASVLDGGHSPHPPHTHVEEEILVVLHGEVELVVAADEADPSPRRERLLPPSLVYYPAWQWHTIRNPGTSPVAYLMLKWRGRELANGHRLETEVVRVGELGVDAHEGLATQVLLEGPTGCLDTLHSHLSVLPPGAGYEPHVDAHDVAIVLLDGELETLGRRVRPPSIVFSSAGEPHGLRNPGTTPARYLVVELHGGGRRTESGSVRSTAAKLLRRARAGRP